ncbi:hypothetical protein JOQ06_014223 [Pogonophryne albipinna]|uniref:Protein kinase domain-containing protein n=1 Tax=Pogonophryne albipinna TaxID=1090488 RepID=A0AAD6ACW3_9TELE|nr:hypothetical protein JOQ06_014223 [Pogonophryne albipinna]
MEELRAFDSDRFNFVTFNDMFVSGGHVCLELEILDMSLFEFLYQKPHRSMELDEIRPILYQVSVTLQLLQSLGVIHTDLKPENIMLLDHGKQRGESRSSTSAWRVTSLRLSWAPTCRHNITGLRRLS